MGVLSLLSLEKLLLLLVLVVVVALEAARGLVGLMAGMGSETRRGGGRAGAGALNAVALFLVGGIGGTNSGSSSSWSMLLPPVVVAGVALLVVFFCPTTTISFPFLPFLLARFSLRAGGRRCTGVSIMSAMERGGTETLQHKEIEKRKEES